MEQVKNLYHFHFLCIANRNTSTSAGAVYCLSLAERAWSLVALQRVGRQKTQVRNWLKENVTLRRGYAWLHWDWSVHDAHKSVWFDISAATLKSPLHSDLSPSMTWSTVVFLIWVLDDTGNWQALVGLYIVNNSVWVVKMRCRTLFPHDFLLVFVSREFNKKTRNKAELIVEVKLKTLLFMKMPRQG